MSTGFVHSVKVPRIYKLAASVVRAVREDNTNLNVAIDRMHYPNTKVLYALSLTTLQKGRELEQLLSKTSILLKEPRLDPWLARVLITELIWGKQRLIADCKPLKTILAYEDQLRKEINSFDIPERSVFLQRAVQKPRYVRVNTLLLSIDEAIASFKSEGWIYQPKCTDYTSYLKCLSQLRNGFIQDFHIPEVLAFPPKTSFVGHAAYENGLILLQDKASGFAPLLLNPKPGSVVLDMCAAPGMKTTHLAAIMKNQGKIYAAERDGNRYDILDILLRKAGVKCATTLKIDSLTLDPRHCPDVEYIMVDPSCSGSGMTKRLEIADKEEECSPARLRSLRSFQVLLLQHALLNFPSVKRVVYSTCSLHREENEDVIDEILSKIGKSYKLLSTKNLLGDNWLNYSSTESLCQDKCLYAKPDVDLSNGFFVAVFERNFNVPLPEYVRKSNIIVPEKVSGKTKKRGKKKKKGTVTTEKVSTNIASSGEEASTLTNEVSITEDPDESSTVKPKRKRKTKSLEFTEGLKKKCRTT